jgi:glycosyltransferase involved in cell wall biosynthesis
MRLRLGYALADHVVAVSRGQQEWMQRHRLARSRKIVLIRPSANLEPLFALPPREPEKPIVLGAMGVFNQQHGFDVLIQAMHDLPAGRARLLLAGFGPWEEKLRALAKPLEHVEFCGQIRDSAAFFARCDAVVVPSRWEPWGMTCLEARAAGKPLIVSRVDGLTEQMDHCGLLVQPEDVEAMVNALGTFAAQNPATLRKWGDHARKSAEGTYERFVRYWKEILAA